MVGSGTDKMTKSQVTVNEKELIEDSNQFSGNSVSQRPLGTKKRKLNSFAATHSNEIQKQISVTSNSTVRPESQISLLTDNIPIKDIDEKMT